MTDALDRARIDGLVRAIGERLDGDWLLIGGAAIAVWLSPRRVTEDVDVIPMTTSGGERLALMELAEQVGLPIEAVNSAADFFVRRIPGWADEVELLHAGTRARIYRPNATLMLLLKIGRLSARDLEDCELVLGGGEHVDVARVREALTALPPTEDDALTERRGRLARLLEHPPPRE